MIVLDIETSGLDNVKCGIWQIGAIDLDTIEEFIDECKIDDEDKIEEEALKVGGKTEEELRDKNKQSQKELLENFFEWVEKRKIKNFVCQSPQFDVAWINIKANKYGLKIPFHHRAFDLHSIAQVKFYELNNKFSIENNKSDLDLNKIIKFCGLDIKRLEIRERKIIGEDKPHNALEDAKLTAECFSRLIYGKNLFPEYSKFEIPEELTK